MLQEERFFQIIEELREKGSATFGELAKLLNVSEGTIRKDLAELDKRGTVKIVRGGAVWAKNFLPRGDFIARGTINQEEKQELVQCLGDIVENGFAIAMNGGTTSIEAARFLVKHYDRLTVITNNLTVVDIMKTKRHFRTVLTGGQFWHEENTVIGAQTIKDISLYNTDVALLAVNSISIEKGITDFRIEEIRIIEAMIKNSNRAIVLADHSKFERVSCFNVCPLDKISGIITDSRLDPQIIQKYKDHGVSVITRDIK